MVKQYRASPASSAGVERVFSAAGRMHDDLRKSMKNDTLSHSLFAAFNTPLKMMRMAVQAYGTLRSIKTAGPPLLAPCKYQLTTQLTNQLTTNYSYVVL